MKDRFYMFKADSTLINLALWKLYELLGGN